MRVNWRSIILYVDIIVAAVLCPIFFHIVFRLPMESFPSRLQAVYSKLLASILLGLSISFAIFLVSYVVIVQPRVRRALPPEVRRRIAKPGRIRPAKPKVKPVARETPVSFISRRKRLRSLAQRISLDLSGDVLEAGETLSPYRFAARYLFYALIAFFISVPAGVAFALLIHPIFLIVMATPAIPLSYPKLKMRSAVGDRKRALEDEVPFFTVFASILQTVGISLYNSFLAIIGRGVFREIEKDALMIKRNVDFFFRSPVESLEEIGRMHPNEKMRTLLLGYTSEYRSGGDIALYLEAKADDYLNDMSFRWRSYAERATDLGETMISLLFVFPMMILMSAFIFPGQALTMTSIVLSVIIPLITSVVFGVTHAMQPKTYNIIGGDLKLSGFAGACAFIAAYLLKAPVWLCIATSLSAAAAIYGSAVVLQNREIAAMEKALPQFLRDITEFKKMGYDINRAIVKVSEENTYNPVFDVLLQTVARQVDLGVRLSEAEVPSRSWLVRMAFFLLAEVVESGGGTARCLEILTNFVNQITRVKRETKSSMRLYQMLSIFTPIGLSFVTALMFTLLTAFSATLMPAVEAGVLGELTEVPQQLMDVAYLLVIASSICVSLLSTKAVDLTAKNTLWITINLSVAALGIAFSSQIASLLMRITLGFG
jgi:flagellar protein FlaJ